MNFSSIFKSSTIFLLPIFLTTPLKAAHLTPEQALQRIKNDNSMMKISGDVRFSLAHSENLDGEDYVYVFNNGKAGFIVASADDRMIPVLGYSDNGEFDYNNAAPALKWWLSQYAEEASSSFETIGAETSYNYSQKKAPDSSNREVIPYMIQSRWGQNNPYNLECPDINGKNCVTGCVATAMAQIMRYHGYPQSGIGSNSYEWNYSTLDFNYETTDFQYEDMPYIYSGSETKEQKLAVAKLMFACGVAVNMNYSSSESATSDIYIAYAMKNFFKYDNDVKFLKKGFYSSNEWENIVYSELASGRPVIYGGQDTSGGHQFICDGYEGDGFFHINWGWSGYGDGFFLLTALNPEIQGIGGNAGGYNSNQAIICGIHPPVNISKAWYPIYANGGIIAQPFNNSAVVISFTDNCGLYNYSQEAVDVILEIKVVSQDGKEYVSDNHKSISFKGADGLSIGGYNSVGSVGLPENLPAGDYKCYLAFKTPEGNIQDVLFPYTVAAYFNLNVSSSGNITCSPGEPKAKPEIRVTKFEVASDIKVGESANVYMKIENLGDVDYSGVVNMKIFYHNSDKALTSYSLSIGTLAPNDDFEGYVNFSFDLDPDSYDVIFFDEYNQMVSDVFTLSISEQNNLIPLEGNIILTQKEFDFTGYDIYPDFHLEGSIANLDYWYDYEVFYENNHYAGNATIRIEGKGNYQGSISTSFIINKINCPEEWISYGIPEEDITYDAEVHEAWGDYIDGAGDAVIHYVCDGVSTVEPPVNQGEYEVYLEYPEGPGVYAIPKRKIGQFTIYELNDDDWESLIALNQELCKENDANSIWNCQLTDNKASAARLNNNELIISKGKIKSLSLSWKDLKGELPLSAFRFKNIEEIYLNDNQFTGEINMLVDLKQSDSNALDALRILVLHNNLISGNAGILSMYPNLEYISVQNNCISDVVPMIRPETEFYYNDQNLDIHLNLDLRNFNLDGLIDKVPSIALYDHYRQSYSSDDLSLYMSDGKDWNVELTLEKGLPQAIASYTPNVFTGGQGETFNATLLPNNCKGKISFWFNPGDVDFNSRIDILDIQSSINYILDRRSHTWIGASPTYDPINFTAANLYEDDIINVQDLVRIVNLIMEPDHANSSVLINLIKQMKTSQRFESTETKAQLYIENESLILSSDTEIAAFDIIIDDTDISLGAIPGFSINTKSYDGKTRLIGYSISGATIPEGLVKIGRTLASNISYAMLSDESAKEIPVTLNKSQTNVPVIETDLLIKVLSESIRLHVPQGICTTWQIATTDGLILHSGSQCASEEGIMIPFKAEAGQIYVISVNYNGMNIHKKLIKK